ncbi:hypothetical protein PTTG_30738, partial [Puccinia triticina 1-1 BBBD Race 1]
DRKPSNLIGRFPFTPNPDEEDPAPEHQENSSGSDTETLIASALNPNPAVASHQDNSPNLDVKTTITQALKLILTTSSPNSNNPESTHTLNSIMTKSNSSANSTNFKLVTDPLNDNNFATWRLNMINALGFQITFEPKALWDAINAHYATRSLENVANVWDKLYEIRFADDTMKDSINLFRNTFDLMLEVANNKLDKPTLETCWIFIILKRLPSSYATFRSLRFNSLKGLDDTLELGSFLKDLEAELRRQQEADPGAQGPANPTALA